MSQNTSPMTALRRSPIRSLLAVTSAILGASLIAVTTAGATYGLFADSKPMNAGIVTTGSQTLSVSTATISPSAWNSMFPGDRVQQSVTLTQAAGNNLKSAVSATATAAPDVAAGVLSDYTVRTAKGACQGAALGGNNVLASAQELGEWGPTEASLVCIEVTLSPSAKAASQGAAVPFTLTFSATQKPAG